MIAVAIWPVTRTLNIATVKKSATTLNIATVKKKKKRKQTIFFFKFLRLLTEIIKKITAK